MGRIKKWKKITKMVFRCINSMPFAIRPDPICLFLITILIESVICLTETIIVNLNSDKRHIDGISPAHKQKGRIIMDQRLNKSCQAVLHIYCLSAKIVDSLWISYDIVLGPLLPCIFPFTVRPADGTVIFFTLLKEKVDLDMTQSLSQKRLISAMDLWAKKKKISTPIERKHLKN